MKGISATSMKTNPNFIIQFIDLNPLIRPAIDKKTPHKIPIA